MMYTVDVSGHDRTGKAGVNRFGGLFVSAEAAAGFGKAAAKSSRLHFKAEIVWVRDEENNLVRQVSV